MYMYTYAQPYIAQVRYKTGSCWDEGPEGSYSKLLSRFINFAKSHSHIHILYAALLYHSTITHTDGRGNCKACRVEVCLCVWWTKCLSVNRETEGNTDCNRTSTLTWVLRFDVLYLWSSPVRQQCIKWNDTIQVSLKWQCYSVQQ